MKKHIPTEELDRIGNKMAQLVDGQAIRFMSQFEDAFHQDAARELMRHPDWSKLSSQDKAFVISTTGFLLIQNACSFERRIVAPLKLPPVSLLSLARVRFDLPDMNRKALAQTLLNATLGTLDINSWKIIKAFRSDLQTAVMTGCLGVQLYCTLKALRRMWKPSVIEQERLNKQLKLMGERAPNSSIDLLSARLCLKYHLWAAGFRESQLGTTSKSRNWSRLRPVAASVMNKCVDHWFDGSRVLGATDRFAETTTPSWCPTIEKVHEWTPVVDPRSKKVKQTSFSIAAAAINNKLCKYWVGKDTPSSFEQPCFSAVVFVSGNDNDFDFDNKKNKTSIPNGTKIYLFGESVNRSLRVLQGVWENNSIVLKRPWVFQWAASAFLQKLESLDTSSKKAWPLKLLAFPIHWEPVSKDTSNSADLVGAVAGNHTPIFEQVTWQQNPLFC